MSLMSFPVILVLLFLGSDVEQGLARYVHTSTIQGETTIVKGLFSFQKAGDSYQLWGKETVLLWNWEKEAYEKSHEREWIVRDGAMYILDRKNKRFGRQKDDRFTWKTILAYAGEMFNVTAEGKEDQIIRIPATRYLHITTTPRGTTTTRVRSEQKGLVEQVTVTRLVAENDPQEHLTVTWDKHGFDEESFEIPDDWKEEKD